MRPTNRVWRSQKPSISYKKPKPVRNQPDRKRGKNPTPEEAKTLNGKPKEMKEGYSYKLTKDKKKPICGSTVEL